MNIPTLPGRDNLLLRSMEVWRPPAYCQNTTVWNRLVTLIRRAFDLQAASIWNDLRIVLSYCSGSALDVGCGAQPYRVLFPASVQYQGIDTIAAQDRFGYSIRNTTYFAGLNWPIETSSINTVLATETLEHVEHPDQFLAEAKRVLMPGGMIVLTVPFSARWHYIPYDYWRFTPSGLNTLLKNAGFGSPIVYARGNELTVACYKLMSVVLMLLAGTWETRIQWLLARTAGILLIPAFLVTALIGQISLRSRGGNDSLGYTAVALVAESSGV